MNSIQNQPDADAPSSHAPLDGADVRALRDAKIRSRKIRRAATTATISAWSLAIFAAFSMLGIFLSWTSVVVAGLLGAIAWQEFRGAAMFRKIDRRACRLLMFNQLALVVLILVYSLWHLVVGLLATNDGGAIAALMNTGDPQMDKMVAELQHTMTIAIYGSLAVVGPIGPALTAWYYASRAKHIDAFCKSTPDWAVEVLREAA